MLQNNNTIILLDSSWRLTFLTYLVKFWRSSNFQFRLRFSMILIWKLYLCNMIIYDIWLFLKLQCYYIPWCWFWPKNSILKDLNEWKDYSIFEITFKWVDVVWITISFLYKVEKIFVVKSSFSWWTFNRPILSRNLILTFKISITLKTDSQAEQFLN